MKTDPHSTNRTDAAEQDFSFFPPSVKDTSGEGREPHAVVKEDLRTRAFPTERQIGTFLFLASLSLYLASMSWAPFPGLPTQELVMHVGGDVMPSTRDPLWGILAKGFYHLPGLSLAQWMGLFSALCGATCASLLGLLMVRVGYLIRNEPGRTTFVREAQARSLSSLVAGLYLACSIPFWMVSTRSLPGSFHVLMLLAAVWCFSEYQHWGRLRHLTLLGVLYGAGLAEFTTFIVFFPLAIFLVSREMFRWRALSSWRAQLAIWSGLLLGASLYPLNACLLFRQGLPWGLFASRWQAWGQMLQDQVQLVVQMRYSPGFLVVLFFSLVPWLTLFAMSRRSPWFYEGWQIAVRLLLVGGVIGVLYNASYAPWSLLGMGYLMVTPYLILAICFGYMAGEFWILGEPQVLVDRLWTRRTIRRASSVFAGLLPLAVVMTVVHNWRVVDGRHGRVVAAAAEEIVDRLDDRDILVSTGVLDESLQLAMLERRLPNRLISGPQMNSPFYLRKLASSFESEALRLPLMWGNFGQFLENLLLSDAGSSQIVILDMPDVFREFGYLVPDRFVYRIESSSNRVDLAAIAESQRSFWTRMEQVAAHPPPKENLAWPHQNRLCLLASKVINNLGVLQAEHGDEAAALETLRTARRIDPENLSVLLNLMELGGNLELPDKAEWEADWAVRQKNRDGARWALSVRYGYVWKAQEWVRRGWVWAQSGAPAVVEAARFQPVLSDEDTSENEQLLDQAYLVWGMNEPEEYAHRVALTLDGRNTAALMALCRISLRRGDPDAAEAYMAEAIAMGLPAVEVEFDRAMATFVRGDVEGAVAALELLSSQTPGDARIAMSLVLLTDESDPLHSRALKVLRNHRSAGIAARLVLASMHISHQRWDEAQTELEQAVQMDSRNAQAWELMMIMAQGSGNPKLARASMRALSAQNPNNFLHYLNQGVALYQNGQMTEAEAMFRKGLQRRRDPVLLNNLATVILERNGNLEEALKLASEAMRREPGNRVMLGTRVDVLMKMGRFEEARRDLQESLKTQGRDIALLLLLAESYEGEKDRVRAFTVAKALARKPDQLDEKQKKRVKDLLIRLR